MLFWFKLKYVIYALDAHWSLCTYFRWGSCSHFYLSSYSDDFSIKKGENNIFSWDPRDWITKDQLCLHFPFFSSCHFCFKTRSHLLQLFGRMLQCLLWSLRNTLWTSPDFPSAWSLPYLQTTEQHLCSGCETPELIINTQPSFFSFVA